MKNEKEDFLGFNDGIKNRLDKRVLEKQKALKKMGVHMDVGLKKGFVFNFYKPVRKTKAILKAAGGGWFFKL